MPYENGEWIDPEEFADRHPELFEENGVNDPEMEAAVACLCAAARGMADRIGDVNPDEDEIVHFRRWALEHQINPQCLCQNPWPIQQIFPRTFEEFHHISTLEIPAHFHSRNESDLPFPPALLEGMTAGDVEQISIALEWKEQVALNSVLHCCIWISVKIHIFR